MTPRAAFVDIGTNTILCLIVELRDGGRFRVLEDLATITRLGQGVDKTGRISLAGEERSRRVLQSYIERCRDLGVEEVHAAGTSALRDAVNSDEVRARLKEDTGLAIRVLSGMEEARYVFLAVQRGLALGHEEVLVIDVGGGSTEFIWGNHQGLRRAISIDLGSVRLTERFLRSDPVTEKEYRDALDVIDTEITRLHDSVPESHTNARMIGIAGTFTTLAAIEKKLVRYSHHDVHGSVLQLTEVQRQRRLFQSQTIAERKKIPGLEPARADVILAGALLIERIMIRSQADDVIVSDQGVRYGLLYERLQHEQNC
jgi:exopolyphosphatase/guanosine-5'-triphosphate,3'-diphosphate pyrophosphatase